MKESSTYQYILQEGLDKGLKEGLDKGREQGRAEGERKMLLVMGSKRLGEPDAKTKEALEQVTALPQLEQLAARLFEVESWQELLK